MDIENYDFGELIELIYDNRENGFLNTYLDGYHFFVDFSYEHIGGIEGSYTNDFEGVVYIDKIGYSFKLIDQFCMDTEFTIERDEYIDEYYESFINI